MISLSPRVDRIKPPPSGEASRRARELRAKGVDIITLTTGEPDFPTPEHICDAAVAAIRAGETRYTPLDGTPRLKQAIATKFARDNGLHYAPEEITVGSGAKQVVSNALMASLSPGEEVIIPAPHWVSYTDLTLLADGVPVVLPCAQNNGFKLRPEELEAAITPRTRWLIMNTPCNPSGAIYSREELLGLAEVLRRHPQVGVMTDDIYEHIRFDGRPFHTMAEVAPDLKERTLTINGVSKAYAMTGWRLGYAGGPAALIRAMNRLQSQNLGCLSSVSQAASAAALEGPQDFLVARAAAFQERRDRMIALLERIPGLACPRPEGAFYLYVDCAGLIGRRTPAGALLADDTGVARFLLDDARVAVVQGSAYGLSPYVRLSIATSLDLLEAAAGRMAEACATLR